MLVHFDFTSGVPLYRQLRDQIVLGLTEGRLAPGEKLPPVRVLAEESGVNTMTVSRAYQQLKAEGYLRTDRRGGSVLIRPDGQPGATGGAARTAAPLPVGAAACGIAQRRHSGALRRALRR